ncbi:hypothetical protein BKA69DRAFT_1063177 [Paraphysoderma sedebokerense]|nr:hypothetical protein BKA69DRAFT_1063177 [Paraphysoderma sedebokerense]
MLLLVGDRHVIMDIQQNQTAQIKGETGFAIWDASVCLAQFLSRNSGVLSLRSLRIIELGAGSAVVSISLLHHNPKAISITDTPSLLKHIHKNVSSHIKAYNLPVQLSSTVNTSSTSIVLDTVNGKQKTHHGIGRRRNSEANEITQVEIAELVWGEKYTNFNESDSHDMIVVSDCIYNESLTPLLISTVKALLLKSTNSEKHESTKRPKCGVFPNPFAIFCQELRSSDVQSSFLEEVVNNDLWLYKVDNRCLGEGFESGSIVIYIVTLDRLSFVSEE